MPPHTRFRSFQVSGGGVFASDQTIHMEGRSLASGETTPIVRHPGSDVVMLFHAGAGEVQVADRVHKVESVRHAHVNAGVAFQLHNTGRVPFDYVFAACPPGPVEAPSEHDRKARPGGVTLLRTDQYDRIPDSGLVRGGMFFLEAGGTVPQISQDESTKIFVFLSGACDLTVGDETRRFGPGEGAVIPRDVTHSLRSAGPEKLAIWVTVTPNTAPSHTRYDQLPDGRWRRVTPRASG